MKFLTALVGLLCWSGTLADKFYKCYWITAGSVDCDRFAPDPTCGSNLLTYRNKCDFSRAHCNDDKIDLRHYGNCTRAETGTTLPPVTVDGGEVVFDFMCTSLSHLDCPKIGEEVCGSDGRPYTNYCEFEKAKCTHRKLQALTCNTTATV